MPKRLDLARRNIELAQKAWGKLPKTLLEALADISNKYFLAIALGELLLLDEKWYVTHSGLLRLAERNNCRGIHVQNIRAYSETSKSRYVFKATVYKSSTCKGFVGYGDADPSNVSPLVRGAEMRVAETRAVNRALRKAYGIGICSVEEIGSFERPSGPERPVRKLPPESSKGHVGNGTRVRDRLCQIIRQHKLDAELVKAYAVDFCGTKTLREASREQVESFVAHLGEWVQKDRSAVLSKLNSYLHEKAGAA